MHLNIFESGIFHRDYRRQLLATLSAILICICHGIGLGWLSPMLPRLLSEQETPLNFVIDVSEASWVGSLLGAGGLIGNIGIFYVMKRFGRKTALYALAFPNTCIWVIYYFAQSVEWLYVARVCAGITGGGMFVALPLFIGEIADNSIRGRLSSFFILAFNTGVLVGYIISSHVPYHVIPWAVIPLPLLYLLLATRYPETPQQLLSWGREEAAERSLKYYCNCDGPAASRESLAAFQKKFDEMRLAFQEQAKRNNLGLSVGDFCNKTALRALLTGLVLMIGNIFTGPFAFLNYMSNIFERVHTPVDPNTNTIIIGAVQVLATLSAIYLIDRHGRKILLLVSSAGLGLGSAAFGLYAFYAEETDVDLSAFSAWLPLTIMALINFMSNVGIIGVSFVVLVEVLPIKIRAVGTSICTCCLSIFGFSSLKTFPLMMEYFGLAATMWSCATISAFCLFYFAVFLKETKGKSMYS